MAPTQLEIKERALKRLCKEEKFYQKELEDQKEHVKKLEADPSVDSYDLKKQIEVQQDTERLLPELYKKIREFRDDLEKFLESYEGTEDLEPAKAAIAEADILLSK
ncbi:tubulin folding cofactor A [Kluyveromyces marxianus]|uniref:Tubulin-specific chaperone A n=2 Tax=Kluyveromyces marxianus TaxID=4911 RepID=W0T825_KLUMD|nr:tubulin-specific chaperone A [Kluyveromyces marxianus DMKU3-1042]KAG0674689.1 tubulin folding cofactor A [Kluyveromyces marxianus]KAG0677841.1 tubulin folding cofactor A [Kluyveromyces marxianus]QGN15482.1 tubulin-specific chaperone A [Kluyveromyces marxianus]BAO39767.1 tubulin-specific chaperone A [Kluyveromyces marxianus DMKU3-1042]BAP71251.1 tubulin-specific chaperone A [Kluyveromyces marxianus]